MTNLDRIEIFGFILFIYFFLISRAASLLTTQRRVHEKYVFSSFAILLGNDAIQFGWKFPGFREAYRIV